MALEMLKPSKEPLAVLTLEPLGLLRGRCLRSVLILLAVELSGDAILNHGIRARHLHQQWDKI